MNFWRNPRWLRGALGEIGCGFLTVLLVTIPVWVFTVATRGPAFAFGAIILLLVVLVAVALVSRWLRRKS